MTPEIQRLVLSATGAMAVSGSRKLQSLWGGYGDILRLSLSGGQFETVILKSIQFPPPEQKHPRGWSSEFAHQRKLNSYRVERQWYRHYARQCNELCYCPTLLASECDDNGMNLLLEDLSASYPVCPASIELRQVKTVLGWLANFHANFLQVKPEGLWSQGSYWHLATRPQEAKVMAAGKLKAQAEMIDQRLSATDFLTLIHGDAKLANFCFNESGTEVAAVDFQYVGAGCGMKDVAYFFSSCLSEADSFKHAPELLDFYFQSLQQALAGKISDIQCQALVRQWRDCYDFAWADFQRFLMGWSPQHWKLNRYAQTRTEAALTQLRNGGGADV